MENMVSEFLSFLSTRESLGELEKAVETIPYDSCFHWQHFSLSQTSTRVSLTP